MTEKESKIDFTYYLDMLRRRKWYIIPTFFLVLVAGLIYCLAAPKTYKAATTISIIRQRVPESFVHSTVTADIDERLHSIGEEILSRTRLEGVITQLNLYPEERKKLPMEKIIENIRMRINLEISSAQRAMAKQGATAFTLSYEDESPRTAALVANTLASMFMEEHLKLREEQAVGTSEFLAEQLQQLETQLKEREAAIGAYKMSHMGELPEQRDATLAVLARLQQQLDAIQESIRRAQDRKILLQQQIATEKEFSRARSGSGSPLEAGVDSLEQLKENLAVLESRYTPNHPDVLKTKKMIEKWGKTEGKTEGKTGEKGEGHVTIEGNRVVANLQQQIYAVDMEVKNLQIESEKVKQKIYAYQGRIENIPRREQELLDLQRNYDNLSASYQDLDAKKLEAERAENLERRQKGEQFRILDPARVPQMPSKPDIPRILAMVIIAALGGSVGLAFGREYIDKSFYRLDDIESFLNLPVLAGIPVLVTAEDMKIKKKQRVIAISVISFGLVVTSVLLFAVIRKYPGALL
ncbi:MAG: XrtA system polysaccharide chain length determinant [Thermodesulfobacteriota bacterium]